MWRLHSTAFAQHTVSQVVPLKSDVLLAPHAVGNVLVQSEGAASTEKKMYDGDALPCMVSARQVLQELQM